MKFLNKIHLTALNKQCQEILVAALIESDISTIKNMKSGEARGRMSILWNGIRPSEVNWYPLMIRIVGDAEDPGVLPKLMCEACIKVLSPCNKPSLCIADV